jgi:hypothetical protein
MDTEMHGSGCGLHSDYRRDLKRMSARLLMNDLAEEELKNVTLMKILR